MEKTVLCLLALLLLSASCFAAWNQSIVVGANDANGQPVSGAQLKISYQKDSNSSLDGTILGSTDANGSFAASLSNSVNAAQENRKITVSLWTYYWEGQEQSVLAGQAGVVAFQVPYALESVHVAVTWPDGKPAAGATVSIYGTDVRAAADPDGIAVLVIPRELSFSGLADLGGQSAFFTSDQISAAGGKKTVSVALASGQPPGQAGAGPVFRATILGTDGKPLAGQAVTFSAGGKNSSATTGQDGSASLVMEKAGTLALETFYHDYIYAFSYQVSGNQSESIALKPQIRIDSFSSQRDGDCYNVTASVSDPRPGLPLEVSVVRYEGNASYPQLAQLQQNGQFASRVCAATDSTVRVKASNKYESVESEPIALKGNAVPAAPVQSAAPPANASGAGSGIAGPVPAQSPVALLAAIGAVAIIAGAGFLARKQLGTLLRFILEYVRILYKALAGRRIRGPPPIIPPEQV